MPTSHVRIPVTGDPPWPTRWTAAALVNPGTDIDRLGWDQS